MKIIIDDAADLPEELKKQYNIATIPVNIHFGTEQFLSDIEMDQAAFYEKAKTVDEHNWPKTSQPSPFQFVEFFKEVMATEGVNEFLTITVGEKLSGTYASALAAQRELAGQAKIHIFDCMAASAAQGFMAMEAARMFEKNAGIDEVMARLITMRDNQIVLLVINSLEYAVKGGRVSGVRSMMASLLNIKPVMHLIDGEVVEAGKVRTHKKALRFMIDYAKEKVHDKPVKLAVLHAGVPEDAEGLAALVKPQFNVTEMFVIDLCVPVAINLGPGTLGLVLIPD